MDELEDILNNRGIDKRNVILTGSEILAQMGIRPNNDLDVIIKPYILDTGVFECPGRSAFRWRINLSSNIELYRNHLHFVGITDNDIFSNHWYNTYNGWNIIPLEICYLMKKELGREKDQRDVKLMERYDPQISRKSKAYEQPMIKKAFYKIICRIW